MTKIHPFDVYDLIANKDAYVEQVGETKEVVSVPGGESYMKRNSVLLINGIRYEETTSVPAKYDLIA